MSFLPVSCAIIICGGRNDTSHKVNFTSLLNDIYLFLIDQKVWIKVKYSFDSHKLDYFCNQSVSVVTDGVYQEQVIIFGGLTNQVTHLPGKEDSEPEILSALTNKCYLLEIKQRPTGQSVLAKRGSSQFA
jgi:hypothetical protein